MLYAENRILCTKLENLPFEPVRQIRALPFLFSNKLNKYQMELHKRRAVSFEYETKQKYFCTHWNILFTTNT